MDTQSILNEITKPGASYLRRKDMQYYDTLAIATATLNYNPFNTAIGNYFLRNKQLPLSGSEIFYLTEIGLTIKDQIINTTTLYEKLVQLMQSAYLEVIVNARQRLKIPLYECLSFYYSGSLGVSPAVSALNTMFAKATKVLNNAILFNAQTSVQINLVMNSTASTGFNGKNLLVTFKGIQSDILDPMYVYDPQKSGDLESIDYTLYNTLAVSGTTQNTYNLFTDNSLLPLNFSQNLPLPQNQRFELQNIELLFNGNDSDASETIDLIYANRSQNYLTIKVNDVEYFNSNISDFLSIITAFPQTFDDGATPAVATDQTNIQFVRNSKTLEIPIVFPASGLVSVQLTQPGSSLNNGQNFTTLFKGRILRGNA